MNDGSGASSASGKAPGDSGKAPGEMLRNIVSLLLVIHIFCVGVALWGNVERSAIESRLLQVLSPYLRPLNLDPDATRFHLVHGADYDDDRFFEVEIAAESSAGEGEAPGKEDDRVIVVPEGGWRTGLARRRYFALSHVMGYYANPDTENDTTTAEIARSIGGAVLREERAERAIVRCRHMLSQPRDLDDLEARYPKDPLAPEYAEVVYEADVWIDDIGQVQVNPRISALETAGVDSNRGETNPADANKTSIDPENSTTKDSTTGESKSGSATAKPNADATQPLFDPRSERYPFRQQPGRQQPSRAPGSDGETP